MVIIPDREVFPIVQAMRSSAADSCDLEEPPPVAVMGFFCVCLCIFGIKFIIEPFSFYFLDGSYNRQHRVKSIFFLNSPSPLYGSHQLFMGGDVC